MLPSPSRKPPVATEGARPHTRRRRRPHRHPRMVRRQPLLPRKPLRSKPAPIRPPLSTGPSAPLHPPLRTGAIPARPVPPAPRPGQILSGPRQPLPPGIPAPQPPPPPAPTHSTARASAPPAVETPGPAPSMPLRATPARPNLAGQPAARPVVPPRPDMVARLQQTRPAPGQVTAAGAASRHAHAQFHAGARPADLSRPHSSRSASDARPGRSRSRRRAVARFPAYPNAASHVAVSRWNRRLRCPPPSSSVAMPPSPAAGIAIAIRSRKRVVCGCRRGASSPWRRRPSIARSRFPKASPSRNSPKSLASRPTW